MRFILRLMMYRIQGFLGFSWVLFLTTKRANDCVIVAGFEKFITKPCNRLTNDSNPPQRPQSSPQYAIMDQNVGLVYLAELISNAPGFMHTLLFPIYPSHWSLYPTVPAWSFLVEYTRFPLV